MDMAQSCVHLPIPPENEMAPGADAKTARRGVRGGLLVLPDGGYCAIERTRSPVWLA
jgi:hypothetical protein